MKPKPALSNLALQTGTEDALHEVETGACPSSRLSSPGRRGLKKRWTRVCAAGQSAETGSASRSWRVLGAQSLLRAAWLAEDRGKELYLQVESRQMSPRR